MASSLQSCAGAAALLSPRTHSLPSSLSPPSSLSLALPRSARGASSVSLRRRVSSPALVAPRASDLKDHGPGGDEWRPPSDWDKAWNSYKNMPPPSSLGLNKGPKRGRSSSSTTVGSSSGSPGGDGVPPSQGGGYRRGPFRHMEQYVTRSPLKSDYPLVEEVDPLRRNERVALGAWTSEAFTFAGFGIVAMLLVFMVVVIGPPPS